jgi:hypothetical protein
MDVSCQKIAATWIALKILTIEHNDKENVIAPQEARQAFMKSRKIPNGPSA